MSKPLVLVTGGTGFVGRHVIAALSQKAIRIRAVVRDSRRAALPPQVDYEGVVGVPDIFQENAAWWKTACGGVDAVLHLAWIAQPNAYLTSPLNRDCLVGTLALATGAIDAGVRRFVGIGTCFEYDVSHHVLATTTPLKPTSLYAATKAAAFLTLSQMFTAASTQFAWCRLFYLYGDGEDERRLVPYIRQRLSAGQPVDLTAGNQIRDYLEVSRAADAIVRIAGSELTGALNVCSGLPITVREFAEAIADETAGRHLLKFGTRPENLTDPPCVVGVPSVDFCGTVADVAQRVTSLGFDLSHTRNHA